MRLGIVMKAFKVSISCFHSVMGAVARKIKFEAGNDIQVPNSLVMTAVSRESTSHGIPELRASTETLAAAAAGEQCPEFPGAPATAKWMLEDALLRGHTVNTLATSCTAVRSSRASAS